MPEEGFPGNYFISSKDKHLEMSTSLALKAVDQSGFWSSNTDF